MTSKKDILQQILTMEELEVWHPLEYKYFGPTSRSISLFGEINRDNALLLISQLLHLEEEDSEEPVTIWLNTDGGSVTDGLAIYDAIVNASFPVLVYTTGLCASAGLIILSAADYRYASQSCTFYYHQPVMDHVAVNSGKDMDEVQRYYNYNKDKMDKIIRERAKMKKTVWNKNFQGRTTFYFSSDEALEFKLIDKIAESRKVEFEITSDED